MLAPVTKVDVDEAPNPPPWQGARRLSFIVGATLIAAAIIWIAWLHIAQTRYDAMIAAARARGEPLALTDFPRPAVADNDNAATYWHRAITALAPVDCPANSNFTFPAAPPYPQQWFDLENAASAANAQAIQFSLDAARRRQVDWGPPPATPFFKVMLPNLNKFRELANQLGDAALEAHFKRNDAEALRRVDALLDLSDDIANPANSLVEYLVSIGVRALALYRLEIIAGNLQFSGDTPNGASPETVQSLIDRLNDPSVLASQIRHTMLAERADGLGDLRWAADQQPILRPNFELMGVHLIDRSQSWLAAADAPNLPVSQSNFNATSNGRAASGSIITSYFSGMTFRMFETGWRVASEQRMVAVNLALDLFEQDHAAWPTSLSQLKPQYLKSIPLDPFAADGRAVGYVVLRAPNSRLARPMLYVDTTPGSLASSNPAPTTPSLGWSNTVGRQWRDVAAWQLSDAERHLKLPMTTHP